MVCDCPATGKQYLNLQLKRKSTLIAKKKRVQDASKAKPKPKPKSKSKTKKR